MTTGPGEQTRVASRALSVSPEIRQALVVTGLAAVMVTAAIGLWLAVTPVPFSGRPYVLPWVVIAAGRYALGAWPAAAVIRSEAVTTTLNAVPLLVGLAFADPVDLAVGLAVGQFLTLIHRPSLYGKSAFNAAVTVLEASVALAVLDVLRATGPAVRPWNLVAISLATFAADLVSYASVLGVVRAVGGRVPWDTARLVAQLGLATALLTSTAGVTLVTAMWLEPWAAAAGALFLILLALLVRFLGIATQRSHRLGQLDEAVADLHRAATADAVRASLLHRARHLVNARGVAVVLDDPDELFIVGLEAPAVTTNSAALDLPDDADETVRLLVHEVRETGTSSVIRGREDGLPHDAIGVPVGAGDEPSGILVVIGKRSTAERFDSSDVHILSDLGRHAGSALDQHRLVNQLREEAEANDRLAHSDSLTGLPNRRGLRNYLRDGGTANMLATVDLGRQGTLSAAFGETVASTVLLELSARLRDIAGRGGVVARTGDRGFSVTTPDSFDPDAFGRMLHEALLRPVRVGDLRIDPEVAVGVVVVGDGDEPSELLRRAAVAANIARETGGTERICVYDAVHDSQHIRRLRLTSDLRDAIANSDLELHYQPKADLRDGHVVGVEALSRWTHPDLGPVSPVEFVDLAEQAGLIGELTRWCLQTASKAITRFPNPVPVAVNLSANDLIDPELPDVVARALHNASIDSRLLRVEVTESVMVEDFDRSRDVLSRINALGVKVSIDDFGAGYASFAHLRRLIADELKLDRSLVITLDDDGEAIVRAVVTLAKELGLHTVAEGVEDRRTWDQLQTIGVDAAQGWYLGKPMPREDLDQWLEAYTPPAA